MRIAPDSMGRGNFGSTNVRSTPSATRARPSPAHATPSPPESRGANSHPKLSTRSFEAAGAPAGREPAPLAGAGRGRGVESGDTRFDASIGARLPGFRVKPPERAGIEPGHESHHCLSLETI